MPTSRQRETRGASATGGVAPPGAASAGRDGVGVGGGGGGNGASSPSASSTSASLRRSRATRSEKSASLRSPASCSEWASAMERSRKSRWSLRYQRSSPARAPPPTSDTEWSVMPLHLPDPHRPQPHGHGDRRTGGSAARRTPRRR